MCGICGIVQLGGPPREVVEGHVLERMTDLMQHRGPDDRGFYAAPGVALGVRRLSIVDVAGGHQPFSNEDGTIWAIQNGELYNHETIRVELEAGGHSFRTRCDTEILPHLYEHVTDDVPKRLRGKFGFAIWDGRRRRALIGRDRLGVKPLYYAVRGDLLVFASELKSLLASGLIDDRLDYDAIDVFLTLGFFPGPSTPLADVRKLPPGHRLRVDHGVREEAYWSFPFPEPDRTLGVEEASELVVVELEDAVRARLMSDVPLGAMLSGGLDSSLVLALMARNMTEPVKTFSVGFVEAEADNELGAARRVASAFGADHHELELSMSETAVDIEDLVWALDEPVADLSALGFMALSELAAQHVTVALAGQGADELFGGYSRHRRAALAGRVRALPSPIVSGAARALRTRGGRYARFADALEAENPVARQLALRTPFVDDRLRREIVRAPLRTSAEGASAAIGRRAAGLTAGPLESVLYLDAQLGLVDDMLHYFDRVSMAHSLEVRVPFLDHRVVELAARIPARLKVHGSTTKYVLRHAARGLVPDFVLERPKVGFFNNAVGKWLEMQLGGDAGRYLLQPEPSIGAFLDAGAVQRRVRGVVGSAPGGAVDALYALLGFRGLAQYLPSPRSLRRTAQRRDGMTTRLTHSVVTPAHNEAENLRRLAACMIKQTLTPIEWVIVDSGSTDETAVVAAELESSYSWVRALSLPSDRKAARGGPVVIAFHAGCDALRVDADVVTKLDADVSFDEDFFERLVSEFAADERLGISGGVCLELDASGAWRPDFVTRGHVRGATRAYRSSCLEEILPLEERMGWDGIDELQARVKGWHTMSVPNLFFRHHRPLGARERKWAKWVGQGDMSHYMGYRFSYLVGRAFYRSVREPAALGMLWGYVGAVARRRPRYADPDVRAYLRDLQTLRALPDRIRESLGVSGGAVSGLGERKH